MKFFGNVDFRSLVQGVKLGSRCHPFRGVKFWYTFQNILFYCILYNDLL